MIGIRTCKKDMTSHGGFVWPKRGKVVAKGWSNKAECGGGLHFLAAGQNYPGAWQEDGVWMAVDTKRSPVVDLNGSKSKCKHCYVVYAGTREGLFAWLAKRGYSGPWYRSLVTGGNRATVTGGYRATVTGGDWATVTGGDWATVTGGDEATVTGGDRATLSSKWWDGERYRITVAYVGEDGIKPNTKYCCKGGKFVEVE